MNEHWFIIEYLDIIVTGLIVFFTSVIVYLLYEILIDFFKREDDENYYD